MKLSCLQENLSKGLSIVGHAVATRATLPILSNVLLATDNGRLKLSATNLEVGISCWIGAKVEEEGSTTVPARTFVDLVGAMPQDRIDMALAASTQTLSMRCGRFGNNIRGIDPAEFPCFPNLDNATVIHVDSMSLRTAVGQVVFASASDESRPILTGVLGKFENSGRDTVTFAAADGYRLAVRSVSLNAPVPNPVSIIVPAKAISLLARIGSAQENPVAVYITPSKSQAVFRLDNVELVTQLIDGSFPDYMQIVPKKKDTRVVAKTSEVLKACKAARVFARDSKNIVRFTVTPGSEIEPGGITVQATSAETGDNVGKVDSVVEGAALQIALNVEYVIDAMSAVGTEQVAMEMTTSNSPVVFRPVGADDWFGVVMPMHLSQ